MAESYTLTIFLLDVSASMGTARTVAKEQFDTASGRMKVVKEKTTDLEWVKEFVTGKLHPMILSERKTCMASLMVYGSSGTKNSTYDALEQAGNLQGMSCYTGIEEIYGPDGPVGPPGIEVIEILRNLKPTAPSKNKPAGDPVSALINAVNRCTDPEWATRNARTTIIYLITDGRSQFSYEGAEEIREQMLNHEKTGSGIKKVHLRILGIDFDDEEYGFHEKNKSPLKRQNEEFWHNFAAGFEDSEDTVAHCLISTATNALLQMEEPILSLPKSVAQKTTLTFGDPSRVSDQEAISAAIVLFKANLRGKAPREKSISKKALQSAAGQLDQKHTADLYNSIQTQTQLATATSEAMGSDGPTYAVETRRLHFFNQQLREYDDRASRDKMAEHPQPLSDDQLEKVQLAYWFGKTPVVVEDASSTILAQRAGFEILTFYHRETYRPGYNMEQSFWVFGADLRARKIVSALARALDGQGSSTKESVPGRKLIALCKYVRKENAEPKLGILVPHFPDPDDLEDCECLVFVPVPFADDTRIHHFPPLDTAYDRSGKELAEHHTLPKQRHLDEMDKLVAAMDLEDAEDFGDGEFGPYYSTLSSFNPVIHGLQKAIMFRAMHRSSFVPTGDGTNFKDPLPPMPHTLTRYFQAPPATIKDRVSDAMATATEAFGLSGPRRPAQKSKREQFEQMADADAVAAAAADEDMIAHVVQESANLDDKLVELSRERKKAKLEGNSRKETQMETGLNDDSEREGAENAMKVDSPPAEADASSELDSILQEFQESLRLATTETGDISGALEDFCEVIWKHIHYESPTSKREDRIAAECLRRLRATTVTSGEWTEGWNTFVVGLKASLLGRAVPLDLPFQLSSRPRKEFWNGFLQGRSDLIGPIVAGSGEDLGSESTVTETEAAQFLNETA